MQPDYCQIQSVLTQVAAAAQPPVAAENIITQRGGRGGWHVAKLRGIAGLKLQAAGYTITQISKLYGQPLVSTYNQLKTATTLSTHPAYQHFFPV